MRVDHARHCDEAGGVEFSRAVVGDGADGNDAALVNADVANDAWCSGSIDDGGSSNDILKHRNPRFSAE